MENQYLSIKNYDIINILFQNNNPSMNTNLSRYGGVSPGVEEEANGEKGAPAVV